ncbi:MAG: hypothetical protein ACE5JG_02605 [Planctomycetota bacterium]
MRGTRILVPATALAALLPALPAGAVDRLEYATEEGEIRTAAVKAVIRETLKEFRARVLLGGRTRALKLPSRLIVSFRRGSRDDVNQWSKKLAGAYRLMRAGQLATKENVPGAEEVLQAITFSTEPGTRGAEKEERVEPWHNMYALFHLIEVRYRIGVRQKNPDKLKQALDDIEQFRRRTEAKRRLKWKVPGEGGLRETRIHAWGSSWLWPHVILKKARVERALGETAASSSTYDSLVELAKREQLSPRLVATAVLEKAEMDARDKGSDRAEAVYRAAGNRLRRDAGAQPDKYGQQTLREAANRALLQGADLLLKSAYDKQVSFDVPLQRYRQLASGEGRRDPALNAGAQAGIGICLVEQGKGEEAYRALLWVVLHSYAHPAQVERSLYHLARAADLYAAEVEGGGGNGEYLRRAGQRWRQDLRERFPNSPWLTK